MQKHFIIVCARNHPMSWESALYSLVVQAKHPLEWALKQPEFPLIINFYEVPDEYVNRVEEKITQK